MSSVRFAVIGLGGMGAHHAKYIVKGEIPGAELVAVSDVSPDRLQWAKDNLGPNIKTFETADALFAAKIANAVLIATPHYQHPPLAMQAFKNDCHVLSEKPAGVYTKHVREMNAAAAASGKVFGLMFNLRTLGYYQKVKDLVSSGELGAIQRTNYLCTSWLRTQAYYDSGGWRATWAGEGGGVLLNQCPHNLDLWQWIAGMPNRVRAFCAFGKYHNIEVEDSVTAYVEYPNGATGVFVATTGEAPGTNALEIVGDRGKLLLEGEKITFWRTRVPVSQFIRESKETFASPETWKCEISASGGGQHQGITNNFVQAIVKGTPLLAKGEEGIHSLELANAMLLSAWTDAWVNLPVNDDVYYAKLQEKINNSKFKKAGGADKASDVGGSFSR
jgi:predicted dehydrogenase